MDFFSNLLKNLKKAPKQAQKYFDPTSNKGNNFWSTDIAKSLVQAQRGVNFAATKPRIDLTPTRKKYNNKVVDFGSSVVEDFVNTPSNLFKSGSRIGRDIESGKIRDRKTALAGLAEAGSPLLNIATLGVGSSVAKQVGKQSVKQLLKYGTKEGAKYGGVYGGLSGLSTGENIKDNKDYAKNLATQIAAGTLLGGVTGAGLTGSGVAVKQAGKLYKKSPLASQTGKIDFGADVTTPKSIAELVKNKKFTVQEDNFVNDAIAEFKTQSTSGKFNEKAARAKLERFNKVADDNEKNTFLNTGLRGNKGSNDSFTKSWKYVDLVLDRKNANYKKNYKELDKQALDAITLEEANYPEAQLEPKLSTVDEVLPASTPEQIVPEIQAKPKADDWQALSGELKDRTSQNLYTIMDKVQKKGYSVEQFADILDNPETSIPVTLQKEVKLYNDTLGTLKKMYEKKTGKEVGTVEKYMPHVREETPDFEQVGQTFFDKLDSEFGFGKKRTGNMTDYVKDPFYAAQRYVDQVNYQLFRPQIESLRTGKPIEAIIKEDEIVKKIAEASDSPKKLKELKLLDDLLEKGKLEGKEIIDVDSEYGTMTQLFRDDARKLHLAGIFKESGFEAHRNAEAQVGTRIQNELIPALESGDVSKVLDIMYEANPNYNLTRLQKYIDEGDLNTVEGIVATSLLKKERKVAYDQITEYLSTHKFHGRLKEDIERKAKDIFILEKRKQDLIDSSLGHIRSMVGRAALGLNLRTSVNNALEPKRAIAAGSKEDYSEALKYTIDPRNVKGILERYGVKVGQNVKDIIDIKQNQGKASKVLEAIDTNIIYGPFNATEGWKDAIFLRMFENEGKNQGLAGRELVDFVMHRFGYYGHKYGEYGTLGIFTNKWARTALQFAQYPMKEAGIYVDMINRASRPVRNKLTGSDLDTKNSRQAAMYLGKLTTMNVALMAALGGLYGASKSEVFGAIPFNIQSNEDGFQLNLSPILSMGQELIWGIQNAKAEAEDNNEDFNLAEVLSRKGKRTLASTVIPAGNQLINKTGLQNFDPTGITDEFFSDSTLSDMERGYNPSASGMARFLAPQTAAEKALGLVMGPYSTPQAREYFNKDGSPLGKNQTAEFDKLFAIDPEAAKRRFGDIINNRPSNKIEKTDQQLIQDVKDGKISPDALRGTEIGAKPVMNGKMTVEEMLAKNAAEDEVYSRIKEIKWGKDYKDMSAGDKELLLQAEGFTPEQIDDAQFKYIKNTLDSKETAILISQDDNPDFVNYYKNGLLTSAVAKELEKLGKIPDAKALMDKIEMTDPYVQKQEMKKLLEKQIKSRSSLEKKYNKKLTDLIISTNNKNSKISAKIYKPKKWKARKSKSIASMLISPNDLIIKQRKLVKL